MTTKKLKAEEVEKLEESLDQLRKTLESWENAGIPRRTLVILLAHYTKVSQKTIKLILEGMDALYEYYFTEDEE